MIIGIDASKLLTQAKTGVEISTSELIKALLREDQDNTYWLYSPRPLGSNIIQSERVKNIVVLGKRFWTIWALSRELKASPPDVFWSPSNFLPYNLPPKSVATIHDLAFHLFPQSYSIVSRLLSVWTVGRAIKVATKLLAVSRQTKKDLKRYFNVPGENIEVVYNSLRTDFIPQAFDFKAIYPDLDKYFIYVGRLELRKNLPNIIRAFHQLLARVDEPIKLVLGGSRGYGYKSIERLIKQLGLEGKVVIKDYLSIDHLPTLYQKSLGVVFASRYEGFGLNILEGFAANVPVMTSDLGAMAEVASSAAYLVDPFNIDSIAQGFYELVKNDNLRQRLIDKGRVRLKDFSWQESAKKLIELWKVL